MIDLKTKHNLNDFTSVSFNHLGENIFGAKKNNFIIGIWDSQVIDGTEFLLVWKSIEWAYSLQSPNDRVYIYMRASDTPDMSGTEWFGPISEDIEETGRYIQVRVVILGTLPVDPQYPVYQSDSKIGPTVDSLTIKATTSLTSSLFYSKTFEIGFAPKTIVLTDESDVPKGAVIRYGVTSMDSENLDDYQFIEGNKQEYLDELSITGKSVKFVIEMSGGSSDEVVVHEFAAMFGGDDNKQLNV